MLRKEHEMTTITLPATIIALLLAALLAVIAGVVIAIVGRYLDPRSDNPRSERQTTRSSPGALR
jgi:capsular polysaccharide biosynthesis protein